MHRYSPHRPHGAPWRARRFGSGPWQGPECPSNVVCTLTGWGISGGSRPARFTRRFSGSCGCSRGSTPKLNAWELSQSVLRKSTGERPLQCLPKGAGSGKTAGGVSHLGDPLDLPDQATRSASLANKLAAFFLTPKKSTYNTQNSPAMNDTILTRT